MAVGKTLACFGGWGNCSVGSFLANKTTAQPIMVSFCYSKISALAASITVCGLTKDSSIGHSSSLSASPGASPTTSFFILILSVGYYLISLFTHIRVNEDKCVWFNLRLHLPACKLVPLSPSQAWLSMHPTPNVLSLRFTPYLAFSPSRVATSASALFNCSPAHNTCRGIWVY